MLDRIALFILVIGGLNWGLVGFFEFDFIAWIFGSSTSMGARIIYVIVALSALWCISLFFRRTNVIEDKDYHDDRDGVKTY
ncbi:MAG: DUF378 domain-containing protein [Clostridiales bacterium]|nr:DUF378 domain-containing protein [Clostridiales bacterium]